MNSQLKKICSIVLAAVMLLVLCACNANTEAESSKVESSEVESSEVGSSAQEANQTEAAEMTIGALTLFTAANLDPASDWNGWFDSLFGIGETLFKLDASMTPQPWLVDNYEYDEENGTKWTFQLKDNVYYTNGEKMTADTVKASLERTIEVCGRSNDQLYIDSIEADGQTLVINTQKPTPALLCELCDPMCVIEYVADGIDYENAPVLTGPFIAQEFVQNDILVVVKNANYWGGEPKLDKVTFKTYTDGDALTMALQAGEIDAAYDLPSAALALFETDNYNINLTEGSRANAIFFNCESENVADVNLRTAIAMAIDREAFVSMLNGTATVNYGMFPDSMSCGGTDNLDLKVTADSNLDTVAELLTQSGYADTNGNGILDKDGKDVSLVFAIGSGSTDSMFAQSLQSQLKQIGIEIEIKTYETTNIAYADSDFDIGMSGLMMAPTGNPQYFFNLAFITGGSRNDGHYSNSEVDELASKLETTYDQNERDAIAFQIEQKVMDDMYYVVFANIYFDSVSAKNVTGLDMNPSEYYIIDKDTAIAD